MNLLRCSAIRLHILNTGIRKPSPVFRYNRFSSNRFYSNGVEGSESGSGDSTSEYAGSEAETELENEADFELEEFKEIKSKIAGEKWKAKGDVNAISNYPHTHFPWMKEKNKQTDPIAEEPTPSEDIEAKLLGSAQNLFSFEHTSRIDRTFPHKKRIVEGNDLEKFIVEDELAGIDTEEDYRESLIATEEHLEDIKEVKEEEEEFSDNESASFSERLVKLFGQQSTKKNSAWAKTSASTDMDLNAILGLSSSPKASVPEDKEESSRLFSKGETPDDILGDFNMERRDARANVRTESEQQSEEEESAAVSKAEKGEETEEYKVIPWHIPDDKEAMAEYDARTAERKRKYYEKLGLDQEMEELGLPSVEELKSLKTDDVASTLESLRFSTPDDVTAVLDDYMSGTKLNEQGGRAAVLFLAIVAKIPMNLVPDNYRDRLLFLINTARAVTMSVRENAQFWEEFYVARQLNEFDTLDAVHYRPILHPSVKDNIYNLYSTNPEEWTVNKLAQKFHIKKPRMEAILKLKVLENIFLKSEPWRVDIESGDMVDEMYAEFFGYADDGDWIAHRDDRTPMDDPRWRRARANVVDEEEDLAALHKLMYRIQPEWLELPPERPKLEDGKHAFPSTHPDGKIIRGPLKKYKKHPRSENVFIDISDIPNFDEECPIFYIRPDGSMRFATWEERRWILRKGGFTFDRTQKIPSATQETLIDPVLFPTDNEEEKILMEQRKPEWKNKRFARQKTVTEDDILRSMDIEFNTCGRLGPLPKTTYSHGRIPWSVQHQMKVERQINVLDTLYQPLHADFRS